MVENWKNERANYFYKCVQNLCNYPRDDKNELDIVNVNFYTNLPSDNSFRATGKCNHLLKYLQTSIVGISG